MTLFSGQRWHGGAKRSLLSGLGLVSWVALAGCELPRSGSSYYQVPTQAVQLVAAEQTCSPQTLVLRLQVSGLEGAPPTQALVDEAIADLKHRFEMVNLPNTRFNRWGEDSVELFVDGRLSAEQVRDFIWTETADLAFRAQLPETQTEVNALRVQVQEIEQELERLEQLPAGDEQKAEMEALRSRLLETQADLNKLYGPPRLVTEDVAEAAVQPSVAGSKPSVSVNFTPAGNERFVASTKELAGTGRSLSIFVDGELVSSPVVDANYAETGITGGGMQINGGFSEPEAMQLAASLNVKALPATLSLLEERLTDNPDCPGESEVTTQAETTN